jgi:hypothetical protein
MLCAYPSPPVAVDLTFDSLQCRRHPQPAPHQIAGEDPVREKFFQVGVTNGKCCSSRKAFLVDEECERKMSRVPAAHAPHGHHTVATEHRAATGVHTMLVLVCSCVLLQLVLQRCAGSLCY